MPRIRKTSLQPKRKPAKSVKIVKPVYPEYLQNFIDRVEKETPYKVHITQYAEESSYNVGVNKKVGKVYHCIWAVGFVTDPLLLQQFWTSAAFKGIKKD
jgi:hypothetical protein